MVDFVSLCVYSAIVKPVCHSVNAGDPAVGMAIEMGTHISEDDIWYLWLGVHLGVCKFPLVVSSGAISGNSLGPFRCVCQGAYAAVQKFLCHGNYCELILSLARASCKLLFAARPAVMNFASSYGGIRTRVGATPLSKGPWP